MPARLLAELLVMVIACWLLSPCSSPVASAAPRSATHPRPRAWAWAGEGACKAALACLHSDRSRTHPPVPPLYRRIPAANMCQTFASSALDPQVRSTTPSSTVEHSLPSSVASWPTGGLLCKGSSLPYGDQPGWLSCLPACSTGALLACGAPAEEGARAV